MCTSYENELHIPVPNISTIISAQNVSSEQTSRILSRKSHSFLDMHKNFRQTRLHYKLQSKISVPIFFFPRLPSALTSTSAREEYAVSLPDKNKPSSFLSVANSFQNPHQMSSQHSRQYYLQRKLGACVLFTINCYTLEIISELKPSNYVAISCLFPDISPLCYLLPFSLRRKIVSKSFVTARL